ncbi:hypothetical protein FB45DRAFT_1114428 [Roridomyces roridus]|uniref:F-box domain-containing protein n=1 Tax=Roridomyces roridus TaxID=1738132 RepID=A0AAD7FWY8_9AGAR|nr:hypothetical protein FB45DRAFT_1114428 [Roridomyces roridus]
MALCTGVYTLPVELLSRVFVLGAEEQHTDSPFLLRPDEDTVLATSADFQLLVSHVCRHWRHVALHISCLWTCLHFREPAHIERAEAFLSRTTTNHSLDILVDTVSPDDHIPGVTLCREEMRTIFALITPHVGRWRAFHLKVRSDECKLIARENLSSCGPAPRLETLQLYHFEDYRTAQNLYIATYRQPVVIFDNDLPSLKNVSLIGVNLPWKAPFLQHLHALELALHPDNIRPPFDAWDTILRRSPHLRQLRLHYSGPKAADELDSKICVPELLELHLTDLDPDHLARLLRTLELPRLATLSLDLPEQDFTNVVEIFATTPSLPIASLHTLRITALECAPAALTALLRALVGLSVLELDFARVRDPNAICNAMLETIEVHSCDCTESRRVPVLPRLKEARLFGLGGERIRRLIVFRERFAAVEGCGCGCASEELAVTPLFTVRGRGGKDSILDQLVREGRVVCEEDEGDAEGDEESEEEE